MAQNVELAKFKFDVDDVIKSASEIKKAMSEIKKEQKELSEQNLDNSESYVENEAKLKSLNAEYSRHLNVLKTENKTKLDAIQRSERIAAAVNKEAVTIDQLRQKNKELNTLRNSANISTAEGRKELELLNQQLDENNAQIKDNVDQYTQQKINIGNYASALDGLNMGMGGSIGRLQAMAVHFKTLRVAIAGTSKGLKLFRIALISTGIGAIVVALGLMIGYFAKTQKAVDFLNRLLKPLGEIFGTLIGYFEKGGEALFNMFKNPQETIKKLKKSIQENIQNRIEALTAIFGKLGEAIRAAFRLDFKGVKEATEGIGEDISKAATGVENLGQKLGDAFGKMKDDMAEAVRRGQEMADLQVSAEEQEIALVQLRSHNLNLIKEQELIAKDQLKTDAERKAAMDEALRLTQEIENAELRLLDTKIKYTELSHIANDTSREEELELANLRAERDDKQRESVNTEMKFLGTKKQLDQSANNRAKKAQDEKLKGLNEEIELYLAQQGTKAKTLEEEIKIAEEVSRRKREILEKELEFKKISETKYQTEILKLDQDLAKMKTEALIDNAAKEIDEYRKTADNKLDIDAYLNEAQLAIIEQHNNDLLAKEKEFLDLKLEQGIISQTEYNEALNELNETNRIANEEARKEREAVEQEEKRVLADLEFQDQLLTLEEQGASKLEIDRAINEQQRLQKIAELDKSTMDAEAYNLAVSNINRDAALTDAEFDKQLAAQKLGLTKQLLSGISGLVDKNSAAGKAIAVAQAGINTFQGITEGLKAPFPLNIVMPIQAGITGLASVKKILATKVPSASGGGGGGGSAPSIPRNAVGGVDNNVGGGSGSRSVQDNVEVTDAVKNANAGVEQAVERGSRHGTNQGSNEGITNLSENRQIQQASAF